MKTTQAFTVKATVNGKSWLTKETTVKAENEAEALIKAAQILNLTDEHTTEISPVTVYDTGVKLISEDYPYGRLRCKAFFSVEFNNKKGMRTVFQTIDPKNDRLNKPKNSTYYSVLLPMQINKTGHFGYCGYLDFNGTETINKGLYFMSDFYELFTTEQIKSIATTILAMSKVNAYALTTYAGLDWEKLKPLLDNSIKTLVRIANEGQNLFLDCLINEPKIESLRDPNFNPFKVVKVN